MLPVIPRHEGKWEVSLSLEDGATNKAAKLPEFSEGSEAPYQIPMSSGSPWLAAPEGKASKPGDAPQLPTYSRIRMRHRF